MKTLRPDRNYWPRPWLSLRLPPRRNPLKPQSSEGHEEASLPARKSANKECGSSMTVKFDWRGVHEDDLSTYSANGWCEAALEGIRRVCGDAPARMRLRRRSRA